MDSETKFKETEIGMIPEDWDIVKVKDVATINELLMQKNYPYDEIEYIDIKSVENRQILETQKLLISESPSRAKRIIRDKDILISTVRPNLKHFTYIKNPKPNTIASTGFAVITAHTVNPLFLYYYLTTDEYTNFLTQIAESHTSAYPAFNPDLIENSDLVLPSEKEQKWIADILSSLDDKIDLNNQMNRTLEQIAQALFKHWFIDFEFPDENGNPYRSSGGRMIESELGEIPEGWNVGNLLDFADILSGGTPKTSVSEYWDGGVSWVSAKDVTNSNGTFILATEKTITQEGIKRSNAKMLPKYTTVVTARGTVGNICILSKEMAINQTNYGLKSKYDYADFFLFFTVLNLIHDMKQNAYGTVFDTITTKTFKQIQITLSPIKFIESFEYIVSNLMNKVLFNLEESQNVTLIRDSLLPQLMTGKIRIGVHK